jgi:hypothetical protein
MLVQAGENVQSIELPVLAWAGCDGATTELSSGGELHPAAPMPASLRRRVTPIGRRALEAAWAVLAGREGLSPRIVLSSRHGEYERTLGLLRTLAQDDGVSPAEFSLAVHHGLAGLLSIATGNRAGHMAIAAGADTLGSALMEAAACLADDDDLVLLMHFDDELPDEYHPIGGTRGEASVLALLLGQGGVPVRVAWEAAGPRQAEGTPGNLVRLLKGEVRAADIGGDRKIWIVTHV